MPKRQVANLEFALGAQTSSGAALGPISLGVPFSVFTVYGAQSVSTGTFAGSLYGGSSSGMSTAAGDSLLLATISNSTAYGYNSSAIPVSWLLYVSSGAPSTGGNTVTVSVACAG